MGDVRIPPTESAMAFRLLVRAQELKVTDPASALQLQRR